MAIPRKQPGNYPAILSCGFRLFFLIGSVWGGLTALVWLQIISGRVEAGSLLLPRGVFVFVTASAIAYVTAWGSWRVIRRHLTDEELRRFGGRIGE